MSPPDTHPEPFALVAKRHDVLAALEARARERHDLETHLDVSRSTVNRAVRDLEAAGLIAHRAAGYRVTLPGRLLLDAYRETVAVADDVDAARDLLAYLPPDAPVNPVVLRGADVVTRTEPAPHVPGSTVGDHVARATALTGLAKAYSTPDAGRRLRRRVTEAGMRLDVVLQRDLFEHLTASDDDTVTRLLRADRARLAVAETVPFGLFVLEDGTDAARVCLLVYDDERTLQGVVVNDRPAAVEWGYALVREYRRRATTVAGRGEPAREGRIRE